MESPSDEIIVMKFSDLRDLFLCSTRITAIICIIAGMFSTGITNKSRGTYLAIKYGSITNYVPPPLFRNPPVENLSVYVQMTAITLIL